MLNFEKVLFYIKKVFFEQEPKRYTHCIQCGTTLKGSQRKFCSVPCNNQYHRQLCSGTKKKNILYKPISEEERKLEIKKHSARKKAYKKYPSLKGIKCEICGKNSEQRHHKNYDKPEEINFLCWSCHGKIHAGFIQLKGGNKDE